MDNPQPAASSESNLRQTLDEQRAAALEQIEAAWQLHIARVEEQLSKGWREHLAHVADERFQEISRRVEESFAAQLEARLAELRSALRRELADRLNRSLRLLRNSGSESDVFVNLLDLSGTFCRRAALVVVDGLVLRCEGSRDFAAEGSGQLAGIEMPLSSAPALLSTIEAKDTTVAEGTAAELSPELSGFFEAAPGAKVGLFPVVSGEKTVAVLCAGGGGEDAELGGLELLTVMAGVILDAQAAAELRRLALVTISEASSAPAPAALEPEWSGLSRTDQEVHSKARRFARVQVAEMRLFKAQAVKEGRLRQDLYSTLRPEIDAAREAFRGTFAGTSAATVDYLHLELVRTLANDDARMLGPAYPGPLV
jgi:hypothetical protein